MIQRFSNDYAAAPGDAGRIAQAVSGDFDCWAMIGCDDPLASGYTLRSLLIARFNSVGSSACVAIGVKQDTSYRLAVRIDENPASIVTETAGPRLSPLATATDEGKFGYFRLKRVGDRFETFYALSTDPPQEDSEWQMIEGPASGQFTTSALNVVVGICSYTEGATVGEGWFRFFRNWRSS